MEDPNAGYSFIQIVLAIVVLIGTNMVGLIVGRGYKKYHSKEDEERKAMIEGLSNLNKTLVKLTNEISEMKGAIATGEADMKGIIRLVDSKAETALRTAEKNERNILEFLGVGLKK